nr:C69 family dipeptidase [uncultured Draconibacterium sp.]
MCTTMIITKGATADGSMMVSHSDDNELSDQRIVRIPAQDFTKGEMRPVYGDNCTYPRIASTDKDSPYYTKDYQPTEALGAIPQVKHTYAYFDGNYGIMNEHNLMIGECTCAANYQPDAISQKYADDHLVQSRIFYSSELSRIALERCKKAINAVKLMGELIEEYGYYSTGETLLVADQDEAFVFEMCAIDDDENHSVWVAQKVPDGEMFVAANEFRIRTVVKSKGNHYVDEEKNIDIYYSKFLFPGLEKIGVIEDDATEVDWLKAISPGEYAHPYYSLRRVWRIQDRVNPDWGLSPWVEDGYTTEYPFSIKPKNKLTLEQVFGLYRDHYEGTEFDLTKGTAAGPYGDPHRFVGKYDPLQNNMSGANRKYFGAWERSISVFYQGYTYVNQVRPMAPEATKGICWFGADVSYTTCFVPIPSKATFIPESYTQIDPQKYDAEKAWWIFNLVGAYARLNWERMTKVDILPLQQMLEKQSQNRIEDWDEVSGEVAEVIETITEHSKDNINDVLKDWKELQMLLFTKYADGYINHPDYKPSFEKDSLDEEQSQKPQTNMPAKDIGYSARWLASTNYSNGPVTYDMETEF